MSATGGKEEDEEREESVRGNEMDIILKRLTVTVLVFLVCFLNPTGTTLGKSKADSNDSMKTLTISGLQMVVSSDVSANEKRILDGIKKAAEAGADFLATPEGSLSGYTPNFDRLQVAGAVERVAAAAKEHKVGLLLGTCYKELTDGNEQCYNQVRVYTPQGEYLGYHAKILRCSKLDSPGSGEMTDYAQSPLRTFEWNGIRFGILICNDFWASPGHTTIPNPYLPWQLKQMGAQLIFHPINSGTDQKYRPFHESSVNLWAEKLGIYIVEVNAAGKNKNEKVNASSGLVGPQGQRETIVPDVGEQFFTCKIKIAD
jgi:predicted amidohydrolase